MKKSTTETLEMKWASIVCSSEFFARSVYLLQN